MLLRTFSAPILNTWISSCYSKESSPESDPLTRKCSKTRTISLPALFRFDDNQMKNPATCRKSDKRERDPMVPKSGKQSKRLVEGLMNENDSEVVSSGGDGGGGRRSVGGGYGSYDSDHGHGYGHDNTDVYYQNMIQANPGNTLLLGNYANFLKEVKGDYKKAEEYCGRAIVESGFECDGNIMCLYADLIWMTQKDAHRANTYFNQAIQIHPNDSYVLASYARFLWDVEEDDEDENTRSTEKLVEGVVHQSHILSA